MLSLGAAPLFIPCLNQLISTSLLIGCTLQMEGLSILGVSSLINVMLMKG